jgi:hypothetical protein
MGQKRTLPAAVRMFGWGRERSSHFESVLLGAPHVPERAGCDADNGMRMMVATRAKPDEIVPELSVQKRVLLYCIASGTRGGAPASRMRPRKLVRGLIDRDAGPSPSS